MTTNEVTTAPAPAAAEVYVATDAELIAAFHRGIELGQYVIVDDAYLARMAADLDA